MSLSPQAKTHQSNGMYYVKQYPLFSATEIFISGCFFFFSVFDSFLLEIGRGKWAGVVKATEVAYVPACH